MDNFYTIDTPLFENDKGTTVGIWDLRIKTAAKRGVYFTVYSTWHGQPISKTIMPKRVMKECKTIKKEYKRKGEPMREYLVFLPRPLTKEEKAEKDLEILKYATS